MAVTSVAICLEGVLQKTVSYAPIQTGITLYHGLASTFNVLLISEEERQPVDYWLSLEALNRHAATEYNNFVRSTMTEQERKLDQCKALQNRGFFVDLVIDPNPASSAHLLINGFNVMTFTHAQYAIPRWRPDFKHHPKPWEEISSYITNMAELRAMDIMLKSEEDKKDQF